MTEIAAREATRDMFGEKWTTSPIALEYLRVLSQPVVREEIPTGEPSDVILARLVPINFGLDSRVLDA